MARELRCSRITVNRYETGRRRIPGYFGDAVRYHLGKAGR